MNKPLITFESGVTNRGKYTFPKMAELATNVLAVAVKLVEK